jgi:D-aminopeptidase
VRVVRTVLVRYAGTDTPLPIPFDADHAAMVPGFVRSGPRSVAFTHEDFREVFRAFRTMFNFGSIE